MRASHFYIPTLKETPADAEIVSHRLMLRSGMIRKVAAGIYSWLPLGWRTLSKVENIVREEMNRVGSLEILMPGVQPAELWRESGRWREYGIELLRFKDRHERDFCLGPTHEEVITAMIRHEIKSYRQLPVSMYQMQWKFRDEVRPRFGVMRSREFLMKDAYSFHASQSSLEETYGQMYAAYERVFKRCGLAFSAVAADSGTIGGSTSHEFHVLADSGEDAIAVCEKYNYAVNVELAKTLPCTEPRPAPNADLEEVDTPGRHTIEGVSRFLGVDPSQTIKTLVVKGTDGPIALVLRGDHDLNGLKAEGLTEVAEPLEFLDESEFKRVIGCDPGSVGPVGLDIPVFVDYSAAQLSDFVCGANKDGKHLTGVNWERDFFEPRTADLRQVVEGDPCPREEAASDPEGRLVVKRGIEVGHVFQLGTKYSESMNATCLDENGKPVMMPMGCYGIGVTRVVAAAIEQGHDENGIIWPDAIAPFEVVIVPIGYHQSEQVAECADNLYQRLMYAGFDVLLYDREERPGVLFAEVDLIGVPHRIVIGQRGIKKGTVEYKQRAEQDEQELPAENLVDKLTAVISRS
ncbi:MAG: Proline--tRNA ligase [Gammaproteobacteria bacterium]|nr:Proline--tRNA ligase [Gammaproteobacteria bacterium]